MELTTTALLYMLIYGTAGDASFAREALAEGGAIGFDVTDDLWQFRMMLHPDEQTSRSVS